MKPKSDEQKAFNKFINRYGLKSYTVKDFEENEFVQKCFKLYKNKSLDNLEQLHNILIEVKAESQSEYMNDFNLSQTMQLFNITHIVTGKKISNELYSKINAIGFTDEFEKKIYLKIEQWKEYCKTADNFKPFIKKQIPRWSKLDKIEKEQELNKLKNLIKNLQILDDTKALQYLNDFLTNYTGLNQISTAKTDFLFNLKLPHITKKISKDIIQYQKKFNL